jgi:hypothetical protein
MTEPAAGRHGMSEQRCATCGHPFSIHRLDRRAGRRVECWSIKGRTATRDGCQCAQFMDAARPAPTAGAEGEER